MANRRRRSSRCWRSGHSVIAYVTGRFFGSASEFASPTRSQAAPTVIGRAGLAAGCGLSRAGPQRERFGRGLAGRRSADAASRSHGASTSRSCEAKTRCGGWQLPDWPTMRLRRPAEGDATESCARSSSMRAAIHDRNRVDLRRRNSARRACRGPGRSAPRRSTVRTVRARYPIMYAASADDPWPERCRWHYAQPDELRSARRRMRDA